MREMIKHSRLLEASMLQDLQNNVQQKSIILTVLLQN